MIDYSGSPHDKRRPLASIVLRDVDAVGVASIYFDRIETWRNGHMIGKARSIDDALRQAINAERRELRRRK